MKTIAKIAVPRNIDTVFDYQIPPEMAERLEPGMRVHVPFGRSTITGFVVSLEEKSTVKGLKPIMAIPDETPLLSPQLLELIKWISRYYICPLSTVIQCALPAAVRKARKLSALSTDTFAGHRVHVPRLPGFSLSNEQTAALSALKKDYTKGGFSVSLIHGVTGSGKTEVYFRMIDTCLQNGKNILFLVPEISLTPQLEQHVEMRFPGLVTILHSKLSPGERKKEWMKTYTGEGRIVIGVRSAVFAPVRNCGLIIVDEEHESSFKQIEKPHYQARDVAVMRGKLEDVMVILGSATPALESFCNAKSNKYRLLSMRKRISHFNNPAIHVIDLRKEKIAQRTLISEQLKEAVKKTISQKKQTLIFLNRRGYNSCLLCQDCGWVMNCPSCSLSYTYHKSTKQMLCHICGKKEPPKTQCASCLSTDVKLRGTGTEKVETILSRLFPSARIKRIDADTTKAKDAYHVMYAQLMDRSIDILVGTQMIAKGLHIPTISLVGIILADSGLHIPDFRASEQTFQLISQVIGRAGRSDTKSDVIIQTYSPDHYAVQTAVTGNYTAFYEQEIAFREALRYPPAVHHINIVFSGRSSEKVHEEISRVWSSLKRIVPAVREPVQAPIYKAKGLYRWQLSLRCPSVAKVSKVIAKAVQEYGRYSKTYVDVDPYGIY